MCGISGYYGTNNFKINKKEFEKINDTLNHRGPDNNDVKDFENENLWLGNNRLSIVDISKIAHQPFISEDKSYAITFNGEIFNYKKIKNECEQKGYKFLSNSDTEVILASYKIWGKKCFNKFNGDWALAIYDINKKELLLSRDRFGIRPLYYLVNENFFSFASELKTFLKISKFNYETNNKEINHNLINSAKTYKHSSTWIKNIFKLEPGSILEIKKGKIFNHFKWWKLNRNINYDFANYKTNLSNFANIFYDSVKIRIPDQIEYGINVSGGLDSSSIYKTIKEINQNNKKEKLFFSKNDYNLNEQRLVHKVVDQNKDNLNYSIFGNRDIFENYEDITFTFENINHNFDSYLWFHYKKISENNLKIVFDGFGADEILGGYDKCIEHYAKYKLRNLKFYDSYKLVKLFNNIANKKSKKFNFINILNIILEEKNLNRDQEFYLRNYLYKIFHKITLPNQLRRGDLASMRFGIENRMPFLDHRLVEFIFGLKDFNFVDDFKNKRLLRDTMKNKLPNEIVEPNTKTGFHYPTNNFLNSYEFREYLIDLINSKQFTENIHFDGIAIKNSIENRLNKNIKLDLKIFKYVNLVSLLEIFKKRQTS